MPILIWIALVVFAMVQCTQADPARVRTLPRPWWFPVILLLPIVGALAWVVAGRPLEGVPGGSSTGRPRPRPVAPDDDPEFLASLAALTAHEPPVPPVAPPILPDEPGTRPEADAADGPVGPDSGPSGAGPDQTEAGDART